MAIEFIGSVVLASPDLASPDPDYPVQAAALIDEAGFDKLLIGYSANAPAGLLVANEVLTTTSRLGVVVTQVPGLVAPTVAARQYATLAAFHPGRVALHTIDCAADGEQQDRDGPGPADRCGQAAEFLEIVKLTWRSVRAFDYAGEFYRVTAAWSAARPSGGSLPVYFSGDSNVAVGVGAAHADVYMLAAAPGPVVAGRIARIRAAAARLGRAPRFGVSLRLASPEPPTATDGFRGVVTRPRPAEPEAPPPPPAPLWLPQGLPPANAGAGMGPVSLADGHDQVARDLLGYVEIGVSTLVIGHDPHVEAADCAEVIERVRAAAEGRRRLAG
jgi:alkanesulfonate monooxygenase